MKKILLTGKINESLNALNERLSAHYTVRFGSSVPLAVLGIIESFAPDIVVAGSSDGENSLPERIHDKYPSIPIIVTGKGAAMSAAEGITPVISDDPNVIAAEVSRSFPFSDEDINVRSTVMVVDDDASMLRMVKAMLEGDYSMMLAPSGAKALALLERKCPDIILLDYEMPSMNGVETLARLRSDSRFSSVPVIFLTGMDDPEVVSVIMEAGAVGYLMKPADAADIKSAIAKTLGK